MSIGSRSTIDLGATRPASGGRVATGDYFHSERRLYRVEDTDGKRALIEDCITGVLIDIEVARLLELERVSR